MHLEKIQITGFRGISSLVVDNLEQINLFVGQNNSSKTTLLEALFLLMGAGNPEISVRIDTFRSLSHDSEDDFRFIFYKLNYNSELKIEGVFSEEGNIRTLRITPRRSNASHTSAKDIKANNNVFDTSSSINKINELVFNVLTKKRHESKKEFSGKITFDDGYTVSLAENFKEVNKTIFIISGNTLLNGTDKRLENLIITKKLDNIVSALKQIDSSIISISLGTKNMIYVDTGLDRLIPLQLFGDGLKRLLFILLAITDAQDGIVLIDEIDNGLHFSALKALWTGIIYAAKSYNVQIFATTHNYEALKYLRDVLDEEDNINFQKNVMHFSLRKLKSGQTKAYPYPFSTFDIAIEEGIEIR